MSQRLSDVVRQKFINYFCTKHGHKFVKSSPVLPHNDRSLNFVNAGMNQFKPLFLADLETYTPNRVCNYQKCIRVGGKMCDLASIGHDFTHHTFFEMLGNWSFNDYGKAQACEWALDFLINELKLDESKLQMTYYASEHEEDVETRDIWIKLGISPNRIAANNRGDNFWEMGSTGPCGISTEIFYPISDDSLLEIWNLVFIDRQRLVSASGQIVPLKGRFVDTGMGLERILSVLCDTKSNYDTDLFQGLFRVIEAKSNVKPYGGSLTDDLDINYRILADHCRMITIALADGIEPGREEAAFELRRIIKRAVVISRDVFQQTTPRYLIFDLIDEVVDVLKNAYPELPGHIKRIRRVLAFESRRYLNYLNKQDTE